MIIFFALYNYKKMSCSMCVLNVILNILILLIVLRIFMNSADAYFGENASRRAGFKDAGGLS